MCIWPFNNKKKKKEENEYPSNNYIPYKWCYEFPKSPIDLLNEEIEKELGIPINKIDAKTYLEEIKKRIENRPERGKNHLLGFIYDDEKDI